MSSVNEKSENELVRAYELVGDGTPKELKLLAGGRAQRTPPECQRILDVDPEGIAALAGIPPGCVFSGERSSGGIALLNHRLIVETPFGPFGVVHHGLNPTDRACRKSLFFASGVKH